MAQHDDLEFFRCSRPEPKTDQLENTLKHDVAKGNHGTSSKTAEKGHYFTQTGLKHSTGRDYPGPRVSEHPTRDGMESRLVTWIPSIAASGLTVYTGDRFPRWKGNVFVGAMRTGEIPGTGHLERIVFNANTEELRRESLLGELRQRIREVRQGPDGLLYLLTDEDDGAILRIEPIP